MILLSKEEIEKLIDPNEMMDQIEELSRNLICMGPGIGSLCGFSGPTGC